MPAEWEPHEATWLSWPHNSKSWPGIIERIPPIWAAMTKALQIGEKVRILVKDAVLEREARALLRKAGALSSNVEFFRTITDDAWIRDHGPIFIQRLTAHGSRLTAITDWIYNCWGGKYHPFVHDDAIPRKIAGWLKLPLFEPRIVLEGGSIDLNGEGCLLTTESCLLHRNRNPHLNRKQIESYLEEYLGVEKILWLGDGIVGDDTDGHIDDIARFVNPRTILCAWEDDPSDANCKPLADNYKRLRKMKDCRGRPFHIVKIAMPDPVVFQGQRLPASYANFYIGNRVVLVPTFGGRRDRDAMRTIGKFFPGRRIVSIPSRDLIWGLGACHCVTQQQPA
ncbi:MAG: agmatine deiminase family protein [Nitrospirae bacterium]|nr:agmatine deiminase family protein [Nitrospirota bacterium]